MKNIKIKSEYIGQRLDHIMYDFFGKYTKSYIQKMIKQGDIFVNDSQVKNGYILKEEDQISYQIETPKILDVAPENIPLDIVYEDDYLAVINKQKGLIVHPASTTSAPTLVSALMFHLSSLSSINGTIRPGIVHRIDKDTSGLLIVAKSNEAHIKLSEMLKKHLISRRYLALVHGHIHHDHFSIDLPIARHPNKRKQMAIVKEGRRAVTHVSVKKRLHQHTLVECQLETGRTHQIRVHLSHLKFPIVGDPIYGIKKEAFGQLLHAYQLIFEHPMTKEKMFFEVPLPEHMASYIKKLDVS